MIPLAPGGDEEPVAREVVSTRLRPDTLAMLDALAESKGVTRSTLVAAMLERAVVKELVASGQAPNTAKHKWWSNGYQAVCTVCGERRAVCKSETCDGPRGVATASVGQAPV